MISTTASPVRVERGAPTVRARLLRHGRVGLSLSAAAGRRFFSRDKLDRFRDVARAVPGRRYEAESREWVIAVALFEGTVDRLKQVGFNVKGSRELFEYVEALRFREVVTSDDGAAARDRAMSVGAFPYQVVGASWLAGRRGGAILGDEPGLGKTMQTLMALPDAARGLVVCPASLRLNWGDEAARWRPDLKVEILEGMGSFRWPGPGELLVMSYATLPAAGTAPPPPEGVRLVADEAHFARTATAKRTKALEALAAAVREAAGRTWLLTGTPIVSRPSDLKTILRNSGTFDESFGDDSTFRKLMRITETERGDRADPCDRVPLVLSRVMLRRRREDVLEDLPERSQQLLRVELVGSDAEVALAGIRDGLRLLGATPEQGISWGELTRRARNVPHGDEALGEIAKARAALAMAKYQALRPTLALFEDEGEPVVVFSAHRGPIEELGQRKGWRAILGGASQEERRDAVRAFQAGELRGIALTIGAGGTGLTLTRSARIVFVDLSWTPAENSQAADRVYRIGQTRGVIETIAVADDDLDRRVARSLARKSELIGATLGESRIDEAAEAILEGDDR